jgi:hypothetical protein
MAKKIARMIHMRGAGYAGDRLTVGPEIDGLPGRVGDLVFWPLNSRVPWWIVEWQPDNGEVFAIVNALGDIGVAGAEDLTRNFRNAR